MTSRASSAVFVGRDSELAHLSDALKRARAGEAAAVLIGGEAGVGKTRLVEEFTYRASAEGVRIITGRCLELGEEGLPFAPFAAALREVLRQDGPAAFAGHEQDFARLLPELGPAGPQSRFEIGRGQLFDLVTGFFERLAAERPLVLIVEDLHWADRSTRDLIGFMLRSGRGARATLIATYRSDELHRGHPLRPFLAELDRLRTLERLDLDRLDRDSTAVILADLQGGSPSAATVDRIHSRSQGNPFFIEELAACTDGDCALPDTLRDLLLTRVDRLDDAAQRVLRVAAAGGQRIPHRLLAEVAGVPEPELEGALRAAVVAQLVVADADGDGYEFRHALVREAVHDDLLPGEHARLHARYAAAIEADPSLVGAGRAAAEIAHHWYAAHDHARALVAAVHAARAAGERYAYAEQRALLERVLELWEQVPDAAERAGMDRLAVVEGALAAAVGGGDFHRAMSLTKAGLAEVDADAEPLRAALLLEQRAKMMRMLGKSDGVAELRRAFALAADLPDSREKADGLGRIAGSMMHCVTADEAAAVAEAALASARVVGDAFQQVAAAITFAKMCRKTVSLEAGLAEMRSAAEQAVRAGDLDGVVRAQVNISDVLFELGQYTESAEAAKVASDDARRIGVGRTTGVYLLGNHTEALIALGSWDEADRFCDETTRLDPPGTLALVGLVQQARLRLARGDASAQELVEQATAYLTKPYLEAQFRLPLLELRIAGLLANGETDAAARAAHAAVTDAELVTYPRYAWPVLAAAAEAAVAAQDSALVSQVGEAATVVPIRYPAERAYAANAAALAAQPEQRRAQWQAAVEAWRADGQPYELARALLRLAEAEAGEGDRAASGQALDEAATIAARLAAAPLQSAVATMARRVGVRTSVTELPGSAAWLRGAVTTLTSREREVLRLVAEGRSNRLIAEALYISPKTASVHVSRIIAKLAVSNRGEAAALAHRLGLLDSA